MLHVVVAPPASNITLDGDGVANATFITDRELSHYIAFAAEVEIPQYKCWI